MGRPSKYPSEFRREAVELFRSSDRSVVEVARGLGITDSTLHNWLKADRDARAPAGPDGLSEWSGTSWPGCGAKTSSSDRSGDPAQGGRVFRARDDAVSRFRFVADHRYGYEVKRLCRSSRSPARATTPGGDGRPRRAPRRPAVLVRSSDPPRVARTYGASGYTAARPSRARVGRKPIARLMRRGRPVGSQPRRKWRRGGPHLAPAPDLLERDFRAAKPNERWVADIGEFPTDEGTLYLAGVLDLCDRSLVGWSTGLTKTQSSSSTPDDGDPPSHPRPRGRSITRTSAANIRRLSSATPTPPASSSASAHRRRLRQRRHGNLLVDPQARAPPHPRQHRCPTRAAHGSPCSTTSRSSTTDNATRPCSGTSPHSSTDSDSRHEH